MGKWSIEDMLQLFANQRLKQIVISDPVDREQLSHVRIRPLLLKNQLVFQAEEQVGKQAFHRNLDRQQLDAYMDFLLKERFRQAQVQSELGEAWVLVSKKGAATVKVKRRPAWIEADPSGRCLPAEAGENSPLSLERLQHNRKKKYLLPEGTPVPFLVDLGVMTEAGAVVKSRYDKFRQINRFLEFVEDVLPALDKEKETVILDFGCGKSYLTFAMYYYLHQLKGYPVRIVGLDLKRDVIERCSRLAARYAYQGLTFQWGDIADYKGQEQVDMVVTLHACDTATDYALERAVRWGARVILSVPCCQHELNGQMENQLLHPILSYGLVKERFAALCTDAIRAQLLEQMGYRTQLLEFIDMEHTPKNILIRAVYDGKARKNQKELEELFSFLSVRPLLARLLEAGEKKQSSPTEE